MIYNYRKHYNKLKRYLRHARIYGRFGCSRNCRGCQAFGISRLDGDSTFTGLRVKLH